MTTFTGFCGEPPTGPLSATFDRLLVNPMLQRFDRLSFLLRTEMTGWARSAPTPSPEDLLSWGTAWALRNDAKLEVNEARLIALDAFTAMAQSHSSVAPHVQELTITMRAMSDDVFRQHFGYLPPRGLEHKMRWLFIYLEMSFEAMRQLITSPSPPASSTPP